MGLFKVAGSIVKGVAKGVGFVANEVIKEATGVDIKSEMKPLQELNEEYKQTVSYLKDFEANSSTFIEKYGIDAYNNELELLKLNREVVYEDMKYSIFDTKDKIEYTLYENAEKCDGVVKMKERIEKMSDKSLQVLLKRKNLGRGTKYLLEQECYSRGLEI